MAIHDNAPLMSETTGQEKDLSSYEGPDGVVRRWLKEIALVEDSRKHRAFTTTGERIVRKYRKATESDDAREKTLSAPIDFPILWSNIQVLLPALYSRMPKVVAERIHKDSDPVGRLAAELAERATHYQLISQQDRFNYNVKLSVLDRLLPGRGQVWLEYKADFEEAKDENGEPLLDDEGNAVRTVKPNTERIEANHTYWQDYLESIARNQYEVRWRAKKIYMTRAKLVKEFGAVGKEVVLEDSPKNKKKDDDAEFLRQAAVWIVQDLDSKQYLWITEGYKEAPLKQLDDPYKLKEFWCCPIPLLATTTSDSTYPVPDFLIYEGLADELNYVTKRLKSITECIRLVGVIAGQYSKDIKQMTRLPDGQLLPIENWPGITEKGGLQGIIDWMPFDNCVKAIPVLMQYQQSLKAQIDEITSMPDIVRGSSDPNDPVYTQQQKSHWTVIKLTEKQQEVQRFCREIIGKIAELIFEPGLFSDKTIYLMAGVAQMSPDKQEMFGEALQLLRDDRLRTFRVGIETDSTIAIDEDQAMSRWLQYLQGVKEVVGTVEAVTSFRPELMRPIVESAKGAVEALRAGRSQGAAWGKAWDDIEANDKAAAEQAANTPPPPDYELMKAQTEQVKAQVLQSNSEFEHWEKSQRLSLDSMEVEANIQLKAQENEIKGASQMSKAEIDRIALDIDVFQKQFNQAIESQRFELEKAVETAAARERMVEEARLHKEQQLESHRVMNERLEAMSAKVDGGEAGAKSNPIHVNTAPVTYVQPEKKEEKPKRKKRVARSRRMPDGSLLMESDEFDVDEPEAAANG